MQYEIEKYIFGKEKCCFHEIALTKLIFVSIDGLFRFEKWAQSDVQLYTACCEQWKLSIWDSLKLQNVKRSDLKCMTLAELSANVMHVLLLIIKSTNQEDFSGSCKQFALFYTSV